MMPSTASLRHIPFDWREEVEIMTSVSGKANKLADRAVSSLLDTLAPERSLSGRAPAGEPFEPHRTPTGCILQAATAAVSVSWFPDSTHEIGHGELYVAVWRGTVARRGMTATGRSAAIMSDIVFSLVSPPQDHLLWEGPDGTRFDTPSLASKCLRLLQDEVDRVKAESKR